MIRTPVALCAAPYYQEPFIGQWRGILFKPSAIEDRNGDKNHEFKRTGPAQVKCTVNCTVYGQQTPT